MAEFKHWVSYFYAYNGEIKGKNVGFVKIDVREGKCRLYICLKGVYGFEREGLAVNLFVRKNGRPEKLLVGQMRLLDGNGEFTASTNAENLFGTGERLLTSGGIWLCGKEKDTMYLTSWEKACLDIHDFMSEKTKDKPQRKQTRKNKAETTAEPALGTEKAAGAESGVGHDTETGGANDSDLAVEEGEATHKNGGESAEESTEESEEESEEKGAETTNISAQETAAAVERRGSASLWENLCRYYPKTAPELARNGVELLQIRPADIRYLPRRLWHLGSNSFLLHGYYRYKHLILGRIAESGTYILGVRGNQEEREKFSAGLFGFHRFLPVNRDGMTGYWYMPITIDNEEGAMFGGDVGAEPEADGYK